MKKLLSILLSVALLVTLTPQVFASTTLTSYANVMSDRVWTFSEFDDVKKYGLLNNTSDTSTIELAEYTNSDGETDDAIKIVKGGSNVNMNFLHVNNVSYDELKVKFDFLISSKDVMLRFVFREGAQDYTHKILSIQANNIYFLNQLVGTNKHQPNTWYNVEMSFNIPEGYGQLKYKAQSETEYTVCNVLANAASDTNNNVGCFYGKSNTNRLGIGLMSGTAADYLLIDNYYQNEADVKPQILPTDDFSNGISTYEKGNFNADWMHAEQYELNGNQVLKMYADTLGTENNRNTNLNITLPTVPMVAAAQDTNYHFSYKFGGETKGHIGASIKTKSGAGYKEIFPAKYAVGTMYLFGGLTDITDGAINISKQGFVIGDATTLYDVEAVYNPSTGKMTSVITDAEGKQFIGTYNGDTISGNPERFAFRNHIVKNDAPVAYFDDFGIGTLNSNGPEFDEDESGVLSGYKDAANLDETVVFVYDRTINQQALAEAVVTLNDNVLSSDDYTITSKGNKVMVSFDGLTKNTNYTLKLQNVKDIISNTNNEIAQISFKTADGDFTLENLNLSDDGVLSVASTNYYTEGKPVVLILAIYNKELTMLKNVQAVTFTADSRNKVLSYDFSELLENKESDDVIKGFVWTDINTKTPYLENIIK